MSNVKPDLTATDAPVIEEDPALTQWKKDALAEMDVAIFEDIKLYNKYMKKPDE